MTLVEFARLVAEMRHAQIMYFRTRNSDAMVKSKQLEAKVDRACLDILNGQKRLFDEP